VAPFFGVPDTDADTIIGDVRDAVSGWRPVAGKLGISRSEQEKLIYTPEDGEPIGILLNPR